MTSAVTSQGCCCSNLQIHPLDLGQKQSMCCRIHEVRVYSFVPPRDSKCGRNIPHLAAPLYTALIVLIATSLTDALSRIAVTIKLEDIPNSVKRMTIIC